MIACLQVEKLETDEACAQQIMSSDSNINNVERYLDAIDINLVAGNQVKSLDSSFETCG